MNLLPTEEEKLEHLDLDPLGLKADCVTKLHAIMKPMTNTKIAQINVQHAKVGFAIIDRAISKGNIG